MDIGGPRAGPPRDGADDPQSRVLGVQVVDVEGAVEAPVDGEGGDRLALEVVVAGVGRLNRARHVVATTVCARGGVKNQFLGKYRSADCGFRQPK